MNLIRYQPVAAVAPPTAATAAAACAADKLIESTCCGSAILA